MISSGNYYRLLICLLLFLPVSALGQQQPDSRADRLYQRGITLFDRGLYRQAANELQRFREQFSEHELVRSAEFYRARSLGEITPERREYYYEEFVQRHPNTSFSRRLLFEMAEFAKADSNYEAVNGFYARSLNQKPDDGESARIYYWMAETSAEAGNNIQARRYFLTLADQYPDSEWSPRALYARGRLFLSESKFDSSSVAFELLRERYPNSEMSRRIGTALGESYYQQGNYIQAIQALRNAIPYLDDDLEAKAVYLIAESHNYLNNFDEASTNYLHYINMKRGTDEVRIAHYGLGWVYHKQQIYHWSADSFNRAAQGSDELARKALYYKAVNEKLGSRYDRAIQTFREFGETYEQGLWVEEAYYEWAITAYEMGIYGEAIEVLLALVRSDDELDWAGDVFTLLGEAYFANKEYTRALQAFEEAEQLTDIDPAVKLQASFQRAWVLFTNQAYAQAQPIFEELANEAPDTELGRKALFWSADAYFNMGRYGPASTRYASFIAQNQDHELTGAARYSLGWSYFNSGSYEQAIEPFEAFLNEYDPPSIALYPYDTDTELRLGDSYYATGAYEEAIETYERAIGAEPGGDYALFQIANSYYRDERTYEAVTTFRRMLRIYPFSALREQAQYNIAYIYLNTGNYTQAIAEFQTVISKYPNTSWAARSQYNIGDAYYNTGDFESAIQAYRIIMDEYPQSDYLIEAINGIQYSQLSMGQADSSSAILEEFLAEHPQSSTADQLRFRQAENLYQSGDYQNAIDEFRQYIRVTNNEQLLPEAWFNLANAYEQLNRTGEAIAAYEAILSNYPGSERYGSALVALGRIYYENGEYSNAFDHYSQLAELGGSLRLEAVTGMGESRLAMGEVEQARQQFETALNLNNNHAPARIGLGKVALETGNYVEASDLFGLIAESNTTEIGAEAQYFLGLTQQRQQNYSQALQAYSNVSVLYEAFDNWVARALLRSAECHTQLGNAGEARNALNSIIENHSGTPEARQAQQILQQSN